MGRRKNSDQSEIVIRFMNQHKDIATGCVKREEREIVKKLWQELTVKLNAHGPPLKNIYEWKKTWVDWKLACRKKLEKHSDEVHLSVHEKSIIELCGIAVLKDEEFNSEDDTGENSVDLAKIKSKLNLETQFHNSNVSKNSCDVVAAKVSGRRQKNMFQEKILINFMKLHKNIAIGNIDKTERNYVNKLWQGLVDELNSSGPPEKSISEWKKVWIDWKKSCQRRMERHKDDVLLSQHEQIIVNLCNFANICNEEYDSNEGDNEEDSTDSDSKSCKSQSTSSKTTVSQNMNIQKFENSYQDEVLNETLISEDDNENNHVDFSNSNLENPFANTSVMSERRHRNAHQDKIFINFMKLHKNMANGNVNKIEHEDNNKLWRELVEQLNANGPPTKSISEWKKVWRDWKKSCRRKMNKYKGDVLFSKHEQIIVDLCNLSSINNEECNSKNMNIQNKVYESNDVNDEDTMDSKSCKSHLDSKTSQSMNNESVTRRRFKNAHQDKVFIEFMKQHKDMANGSINSEDREHVKTLWQELTNKLNAKGPPQKRTNEWMKAWTDWRRNTLKKIKQQTYVSLSEHERVILKLCGVEVCEDSDNDNEINFANYSTISKNQLGLETLIEDSSLDIKPNLETCFREDTTEELCNESSLDLHSPDTSVNSKRQSVKPSPSSHTSSDMHCILASIQLSLKELTRLMAEQNREQRRHHLAMEKAINSLKH